MTSSQQPLVGEVVKSSRFIVLALASCMAVPSMADVWNEVGDAGDLAFNSQLVTTSGPLTSIVGHLAPNGGDAIDLYQIHIGDPANFQATTVGGASWDTMLFLFHLDSTGEAANDDSGSLLFPNFQSRIGGPIHPVAGLTSGDYFLGIGYTGTVARDASNTPVFTSTSINGVVNPLAGGLQNWVTGSNAAGNYTIFITGSADPVPEPVSLIGLTLGAATLWRRRRRATQ